MKEAQSHEAGLTLYALRELRGLFPLSQSVSVNSFTAVHQWPKPVWAPPRSLSLLGRLPESIHPSR